MEHKFEWTIPWVAFSKHTFTWSAEWYIEFLKELEKELENIPSIFSKNPDDTSWAKERLLKQNKALVWLVKDIPEAREWLDKYKEENGL